MKKYIKPEISICFIDNIDIVTVSGLNINSGFFVAGGENTINFS